MRYLDFVAIGDITSDAFITLKDATVTCGIDRNNCTISMRFGDKIPYESLEVVHGVGNSANAAVAASRLGLGSALVSDVGDDQNGKEDILVLEKDAVITDYIRVHEDQPSNYHFVLQYEEERTILVKHQKYPYMLPHFPEAPKWIYLSSIGENSLRLHRDIAEYVKAGGTKLAFQPGTFQLKLGIDGLRDIYAATEFLCLNLDEARRLLNVSAGGAPDLIKRLHMLGPKIVAITDSRNGAWSYDGKEIWHIPMYPDPKPPISRTGAGDAFASTFTSALALGKSVPEALSWGPINSMSVVQHIGAQKGLLHREKLEEYLRKAPEAYKAVRV